MYFTWRSENCNLSVLNDSSSCPSRQPTQYPSQYPILRDCRTNASNSHARGMRSGNNLSDSDLSFDLFPSPNRHIPLSIPSTAEIHKNVSRRHETKNDAEYSNHSSFLEDPSFKLQEICSDSEKSYERMSVDFDSESELTNLHQVGSASLRLQGSTFDSRENITRLSNTTMYKKVRGRELYCTLYS